MLEGLISRMFATNKAHKMWVNGERGKAFWSKTMNDYKNSGYKCYDQEDLLRALHYILFETHVKFAGNIFKQTKGIPMGGNASPFIADLCLAWAEFQFMMNLSKSKEPEDSRLLGLLSNNSRYIDDISVLNYLSFGELAKPIYHEELLLEESTFGYHYDHFLDLNVRICNGRFVTGIYHKVDDFDFEVISFPFPESNIHSKVGYNCFYSQLIRFFRLCNNDTDFSIRVRMLFFKLSGRGYSSSILKRYFLKFCGRYPVDLKYNVPDGSALWESTFESDRALSCSIYDYEAIGEMIKPCKIVLRNDLDPSYTIPKLDVNETPMSDTFTPNTTPVEDGDDTQAHIPLPLSNPKNHCYINSALQVIWRILMYFNDSFHINDNREGCMLRCLVDDIQANNNNALFNFKSKLGRFDSFFNGQYQQDVFECWTTLVHILHIGTRLHLLGDNSPDGFGDDQFVYSLSKRLFLFNLKQTSQCLVCRLKTTSYKDSQTYFLYPESDCNIKTLLETAANTFQTSSCSSCSKNTEHEISTHIHHSPEILVLVISRFNTAIVGNKNRSQVFIDETLKISNDSFRLIGTIHHHGRTINSGHYTCNIFYHHTAYTCNDSHITPFVHSDSSDSVYLAFYSRS